MLIIYPTARFVHSELAGDQKSYEINHPCTRTEMIETNAVDLAP
jgi:hypothetical protein